MRRRKPRVVWLPPDTTNNITDIIGPGGNVTTSVVGHDSIDVTTNDPINVKEFPLVIDTPADPLASSLSDVENSGYRLRRIVGNIWVHGDQTDEESGIFELLVEAAIIVRRVGNDGVSFAEQADTIGTTSDNRSTLSLNTHEDPWVWMRAWWLYNPEFFTQTPRNVESGSRLPTSNFAHGPPSVNGPHVDQKTARIVGPDERLFLQVSIVGFGAGQADLVNSTRVFWHLRCLGTLRTNSGNRRNASR